mmetsp:Transcript_78552/g.230433  ORF Transcript_78552/g.230433 Transcript_78552/m.230433 type:complete len:226 (+) Transcript_78552:335-1012(+)
MRSSCSTTRMTKCGQTTATVRGPTGLVFNSCSTGISSRARHPGRNSCRSSSSWTQGGRRAGPRRRSCSRPSAPRGTHLLPPWMASLDRARPGSRRRSRGRPGPSASAGAATSRLRGGSRASSAAWGAGRPVCSSPGSCWGTRPPRPCACSPTVGSQQGVGSCRATSSAASTAGRQPQSQWWRRSPRRNQFPGHCRPALPTTPECRICRTRTQQQWHLPRRHLARK